MPMPVQALAANPGAVWTHAFYRAADFPELVSTFAGRTFTTHWGCPGAAEHLEANGAFGVWSNAIAFHASPVEHR